jgi:hypothetical protein
MRGGGQLLDGHDRWNLNSIDRFDHLRSPRAADDEPTD